MNIQTQTLVQSISTALLNGKVQTQDDLVILARVVMTDLNMSFTNALRFVNDVVTSVMIAQDALLSA